jgi:3-isopropylmalate dehydrogenase
MKIVTLPGDGIGPEVLAAALEILDEVAPDLSYERCPARR